MPRYRATLHGRGTVEIAAFGVADAEARLEKELRQIDPRATLLAEEIRRADESPRIVESFLIAFRIRLELEVDAADERGAPRAAFAAGRRALEKSRFVRVAWERAEIRMDTSPG